ncbi:hypothetical protein [Vibrio phage VP16T]|nr:hypothetical protein [Vibrio phage VP16T]
MIYRCAISPADGLRLQQDGQNLRVDIQFGGGMVHSTPVLLPPDQVELLARTLVSHIGIEKLMGKES